MKILICVIGFMFAILNKKALVVINYLSILIQREDYLGGLHFIKLDSKERPARRLSITAKLTYSFC